MRRCRSSCRAAQELARAAVLGARSHLSDVQRGLLGHRGRGLDAAGAVRGGAASRPRCSRSSRRGEPEVHGLVALMEIQASRTARAQRARRRAGAADGAEPRAVGSAADQPRAGCAGARRGAGRARAGLTCCRRRSRPVTRAPSTAADTDWVQITALYDELAQRGAVAGHRAQSRGRGRDGARPGGRASRSPIGWRRMARSKSYHLLPSVRGDLLARLGRLRGGARGIRARRGADAE